VDLQSGLVGLRAKYFCRRHNVWLAKTSSKDLSRNRRKLFSFVRQNEERLRAIPFNLNSRTQSRSKNIRGVLTPTATFLHRSIRRFIAIIMVFVRGKLNGTFVSAVRGTLFHSTAFPAQFLNYGAGVVPVEAAAIFDKLSPVRSVRQTVPSAASCEIHQPAQTSRRPFGNKIGFRRINNSRRNRASIRMCAENEQLSVKNFRRSE